MHIVHGFRRYPSTLVLLAGWWILSSAAGQLLSPESSTPEIQLTNGSSYVILDQTLRLSQGSQIGFSFRTCISTGKLFRDASDLISVSLAEAGGVRLSLGTGQDKKNVTVGSNLADGLWHTVRLSVYTDSLCVSVDSWTDVCVGGELSARLDSLALLSNEQTASPLQVGEGLVGCIRSGPQFLLPQNPSIPGIVAGTCNLPQSCSGYDWNALVSDVGVECPGGCENGGVCLPLAAGSPAVAGTATSSVVCSCSPGYTGPTCSTPTTSCLSSPCRNAGRCSQGVCDCSGTGYSGSFCEVEADHCSPASTPPPCLNAGRCFNQPAGFLCSCPPEFSGAACATRTTGVPRPVPRNIEDPCLSVPAPCSNGGSCMRSQDNTITCICPTGFSGSRCEVASNPCSAVTCPEHAACSLNATGAPLCSCAPGYSGPEGGPCLENCAAGHCKAGSTCTNTGTSFSCACPVGRTGRTCEELVEVDPCLQAPCTHGNCSSTVTGYSCACEPGWIGSDCEVEVDECASSPCINGSCQDKVNDYECTCPGGYTGKNCENQNDCVAEACSNGGTCIDGDNQYTCECASGFMGLRCETPCKLGFHGPSCSENIDDCLNSPCLHGATCSDLVANYTCTCANGWTGRNCAEDVDECLVENICRNGICKNVEGGYECYCRPGYTNDDCSVDVDECLSAPCQNNGTCANLVNAYSCTCPPGFNGTDCEHNIDECVVEPCKNGATCIDGSNNYTCNCVAGYTGFDCEINIDDCAPAPCLNGGLCSDGVNSYTCNCNNTGFTGPNCELDIDECAVQPCKNNATCNNLNNDYSCNCWTGFEGKDCENDEEECAKVPCKNNGTCYELSNQTLYTPGETVELPTLIRPYFSHGFSYENASGYVCSCPAGIEGPNCEINIDDCAGNPCRNGAECVDGINEYICLCEAGFEGDRCQTNINECEKYSPCKNNAICTDLVADYNCDCLDGYGGKNCSVELTGCMGVTCYNGGTCVPWLVGEDDHRGNCTCAPGFDGQYCQLTTTFSFKGGSYVSVESGRNEGFALTFRFRTTISNGLMAMGALPSYFQLKLVGGRLNLHSPMLSMFEGIYIGENLSDTKWHKVDVAFNISHLTIGLDDRNQAIHLINPGSSNDTSFKRNYLGGAPEDEDLKLIRSGVSDFIGCMQDISVNGVKVRDDYVRINGPKSQGISEHNTEKGCIRKDQCIPDPCKNGGQCEDLWRNYKCKCTRPFLGPSCQYNYTGATFGFENITDSQVKVRITEPNEFTQGIDLTMFFRTRKRTGIIFYLGVDPSSPVKNQIIGRLVNGTLEVEASLSDTPEYFKLYSVQLDNGFRHFISVTRMKNQMTVKLNGTIYIKQEISSVVPIKADWLYLGNLIVAEPTSTALPAVLNTTLPTSIPTTTVTTTTTTTTDTTTTSSRSFTLSSSESPVIISTPAVVAVPEGPIPTTTETVPVTIPVLEDFSAVDAEPILSRGVRQVDILASGGDFEFFKGVIQDVQLSNGNETRKIVKLFELDFAENVTIEESLGEVSAMQIQKGVVSDNTCRVNPCLNDGICQVTWNDYTCECQPGYKGANCSVIEYCYWNQCPEGSTCKTLVDGHECLSNATFNGINSNIVYESQLNSVDSIDTISATFRTKTNGTLLHIVGKDNKKLQILVVNGQLKVVLPVESKMNSLTMSLTNTNVNDGQWHNFTLTGHGGIITATLDGIKDESAEIYLEDDDSQLDILLLVQEAMVVLGSQYNVGSASVYTDFFRGCVGEMRIGDILLPYFTETELVNSTASNKFILAQSTNLTTAACVLCYENDCVKGYCEDPSEKFECQCPTGYEGPTCAIDIDDCVNNTCVNGLCVDGEDMYSCLCDPGWIGDRCQIDKDECADLPCMNGGTCTQTVEPGSYICSCSDEYKGQNCTELKVRTCREQPCTNGATCIPEPENESSDKFRCDCAQGYEGTTCESQINFCVKLNANCQNGGTCRSDFASFNYKCVCISGYNGANCENNINDCAGRPCKNNATCNDLVNSYSCDCSTTGFEGPNCEQNINECLGNPCLNGARCNDTLGDYSCFCPGNYCGKNCQRTDPCQTGESLCLNEGRCEAACDTEPFYRCSCPAGWEGPSCNLKSSSTEELALIIGPIVGGMAFIVMVGLLIFLVLARRKRKGEGHYRPAKQELTSPRLQLDTVLKVPPEERLI